MTYLKHYWWMSREENVNKAILQGPMVRQDDVNQIKWYKMVLARAVARLVARQKWISDAVRFLQQSVFHISAFSELSLSPPHPLKAFLSLMKLAGQKWSFTEVHLYSWGTFEVHPYLTRICICKARSSANESLRWTKVKRSVLPQHVFHQGQPGSSCGCGQIRKGGQAAKSENHS